MKHSFYIEIRNCKNLLLCFIMSLMILGGCDSRQATESKPNVVIIFCDDLGYADISPFGAEAGLTPHLDKMSENGMTFTSFYASTAVCSASRASLLTGCYPPRVSVHGAYFPNSKEGLNPDEVTLAELLKEQGYSTGIFGKWHLGDHPDFSPLKQGFDEYLGIPYSNDMWPVCYNGKPASADDCNWKQKFPPLPLIDGYEQVNTIATLDDQGEVTKRITERATDFIKRNKENPFFVYLPHPQPHVPIAASPQFRGKSGMGLYGDVVMEIDWSVGEIIRTLKENDLEENTIVIFTSDNGPWLNFGNHAGSAYPLREGKGNMWEGGCRVPCVMQYPGVIPAGSRCNNMASTIDLLPTISSLAGGRLPENEIDGVDVSDLIKGDFSMNPRREFLYYYGGKLTGVRKDKWKLQLPRNYRSYEGVEPVNDGYPGPYSKGVMDTFHLFDLNADVEEQVNLASQYPEVVADLLELVDTARIDLGDRITKFQGKEVRPPGLIRTEGR
ncbi:MAG: sulfatase [Saprospiraceae bacterium]|nr:sulfatase [Saprospiraceae bacterium]